MDKVQMDGLTILGFRNPISSNKIVNQLICELFCFLFNLNLKSVFSYKIIVALLIIQETECIMAIFIVAANNTLANGIPIRNLYHLTQQPITSSLLN